MDYKREGYKVTRLAFFKLLDDNYEVLLNEIEPFKKVESHYHKKMTEVFIFQNNALLQLKDVKQHDFINVKKGKLIVIKPLTLHSIKAGIKGCKLIVFRFPYTKGDRYNDK